MNTITFCGLSEISEAALLDLMNNEQVAAYMPLLKGGFTSEDCQAFLEAKSRMWEEHGYGPWAFIINGEFAGWGGLQPEHGEPDFALVLHPRFWGWSRKIFQAVAEKAFTELRLKTITILFPPTRKNSNAILRAGFTETDHLTINGEEFIRYRLVNPNG